jgi:hypothetical protein
MMSILLTIIQIVTIGDQVVRYCHILAFSCSYIYWIFLYNKGQLVYVKH